MLKVLATKLAEASVILLLTVIYFAGIVPMSWLMRSTREIQPFYYWEKSPDQSMQSWIDKPITEIAMSQFANYHHSKIFQLLEIFVHFIRHEEMILLPTLLLMLMIGLTGVFIHNSVIPPSIYTLF
jgi:hypothetical protein